MRRVIAIAVAALSVVAPLAAMAETVTVILKLEPTKSTGKSWDVDAGADPVLCLRSGCYRSRGAAAPARFMAGKSALSPFAALNLSGKAGACTGTLACVFRGVDLAGGVAALQPIDVDIDRHDRLPSSVAGADTSCNATKGGLSCYGGFYTRDYSLWVIPEVTARGAGALLLATASTSGLETGRRRFAEEFASEELGSLGDVVIRLQSRILGEEVDGVCAAEPRLVAETLQAVGLIDPANIAEKSLLRIAVADPSDSDAARAIEYSPSVFWSLHAMVERLHALVAATSVRRVDFATGVTLRQHQGDSVLEVGGETVARVQALVDACEGIEGTDMGALLLGRKPRT